MTDPNVDAERRAAEVIETHEYAPCAHLSQNFRAFWGQCEGCDWKGPRRTERNSPVNDHRAHVAAMLAQAGVLADAQHDADDDLHRTVFGAMFPGEASLFGNQVTGELRSMHERSKAIADALAQHDAEVAAKALQDAAAALGDESVAFRDWWRRPGCGPEDGAALDPVKQAMDWLRARAKRVTQDGAQ